MRRSAADLSRRAAEIFRREGARGVASRFLSWLRRLVWDRSELLVFEHDLRSTDFAPRVPDVVVLAVTVPEELERLPAGARQAIEGGGHRIGQHLENGGMVFCGVVAGKLAHLSWVAVRRPSSFDPVAPHLDYDGFGYIGACETFPEYRGLGLYPLVLTRACEALRSGGISRALLTVSPENRSSIAGVLKAGFRPAGRGTLTRFLSWTSWRRES